MPGSPAMRGGRNDGAVHDLGAGDRPPACGVHRQPAAVPGRARRQPDQPRRHLLCRRGTRDARTGFRAAASWHRLAVPLDADGRPVGVDRAGAGNVGAPAQCLLSGGCLLPARRHRAPAPAASRLGGLPRCTGHAGLQRLPQRTAARVRLLVLLHIVFLVGDALAGGAAMARSHRLPTGARYRCPVPPGSGGLFCSADAVAGLCRTGRAARAARAHDGMRAARGRHACGCLLLDGSASRPGSRNKLSCCRQSVAHAANPQ
ncbi:MAG: hypothetical protein MOGDAGHF_01741 [Rhodocyclaceae bacterium]|nr:hypothetical protein [Rhodocyclaceae bacterium]